MIMDYHLTDTRAVVPAIAFVLLLTIALSSAALFQVEVVPEENWQTEYEHSEDVQSDLVELRDLIHRSGTSGTSSAMPIGLGTQYDSRLVGINPPTPTGSISTTEPPENITIRIDGNETDFETTFLEYEPNYREYEAAPTTTIEHTLVYNTFPNAETPITVSDHRLLEDDRLTIPVISGDISERDVNAVSIRVTALDPSDDEDEDIQFSENDTVSVTLPTEEPKLWEDELKGDVDSFKNTSSTVTFNATVEEFHLYFVDVDARPIAEVKDPGVDDDSEDQDGAIRCEEDCTPTKHDEVNEDESFADETLIIPEGEDFVPDSDEDANFTKDDSVDYTFASYEIEGNVETNNEVSFTSTDGDIYIGENGSTVSGREFEFKSAGDIIVDGATLTTSNDERGGGGQGNEDMTFTADGNISAVNSTLAAGQDIEMTATGGTIDLTGAFFDTSDTHQGGDIDVILDAENVICDDVESGDDVNLPGECE